MAIYVDHVSNTIYWRWIRWIKLFIKKKKTTIKVAVRNKYHDIDDLTLLLVFLHSSTFPFGITVHVALHKRLDYWAN